MNTKDLWQALTCNSNTEPYFDWIFAADALTKINEKPELIICNTDPSNLPGKHWLLFFFYDNTVDYFDSLGKDLSYYGKEFVEFVNRFAKFYKKKVMLGFNQKIQHYVVIIVYILLLKDANVLLWKI